MTDGDANQSTRYARIAIVTGASSGIGEAIARKFIAIGYAVIGNARNGEKLQALAQTLGDGFCGIVGDATDQAIIDKLFDTAVQHFGRPADIVVANAGRGLGGSVVNADLSKFEEVLKLNVTGALALLQKAASKMLADSTLNFPERAADIVIIGSVVGRNLSPFSAVYGATKFAVHSLAEGLRREIGPKGIRVSLVEPGIVISGFQDAAGYSDDLVQNFNTNFGPLLHGDDVANAVEFIVTQPPHVHISEIMVRPTRQEYP